VEALAAAPDLSPPLLAPPGWLVEEAWELRPPPRDELAHLLRDEAGLLLDRLLVRVARGHGALDVAIGEGLAALAVGDRALQLGYSSIGDYARERFGIKTRAAETMARLARELRSRPLLRAAVWRGEVSPRKAQAVLPLAVGDGEAEWVARARAQTVRALEAAARERGPARDGDDEIWERLEVELSAEDRAIVDEAFDIAGRVLGGNPPKWRRLEALCEEYLGAHPVELREDEKSAGEAVRRELDAIKEGLEAEFGEWRWLDEAHAETAPPGRGPGPAVQAPLPDSAEEPFVDVVRLDAELRRLAAMRARWDELLGHLAMLVQYCGLWRDMKFARFGHYCTERLGMAERTVAQRTALERKLYEIPALREALRARRISYEKARLVASVADETSVDGWIAQAERSTCIALEHEIEAREEAQVCARRSLAVVAPRRVGVLVASAFEAAREAEGRWLRPGECLARVAAHFIQIWRAAAPKFRTRSHKVLARDGCMCQVPGCSRPAVHAHHVRRRSAGGSDEEWNLVALCAAHHLHGVHAGYIRVSGTAPDALIWELGRGWDGAPLEVFETARASA
jgi:hypothetical protein